MPDEHQHLRLADRHIADSERRITEQEIRIEALTRAGGDTRESTRLLENYRGNLAEMYIHRRMILDRIASQEGG